MMNRLIAFESVHHALHAEKVLKGAGIGFDLIPTPREISASCGQSIALAEKDMDKVLKIMSQEKVYFRWIFFADFRQRIYERLYSCE